MAKTTSRLAIAIAVLLIFASPASALEKYLCVAEQSVGFRWNGSAWEVSRFKVDDDKYIVKEVKEYGLLNDQVNFEVTKLGQEFASHHCFRNPPNPNIPK